MSNQRTLQCVGPSDEDIAHLRLLLRMSRNKLHDAWTWGTEFRADLVVVDTRRLIGDSAMRRAQQRGIAFAQIVDADDPKPLGLFLRRPFRRDAFVTLLNKVGSGDVPGSEVDSWSDEFLELDLGEADLSALEADHPPVVAAEWPAAVPPAPAHAGGSQPAVEPLQAKESSHAARTDHAQGSSEGHGLRAEAWHDASRGLEVETPIDPNATFPLAKYLDKGLLKGPVRISLRGVPSLMLDPVEKMFWARGLLRALEPYARVLLRHGDWVRLERDELEEARRGIAARPYERLIWLDRYIHSEGFLASHFDSGGTFRLTNRFDLSLDYPRAYRVGNHMTVWRKLHEIARASAVGLGEVFDVVNAYDAVGYVEWGPDEAIRRKSF